VGSHLWLHVEKLVAFESKDYVALAFSALALALSGYNLVRGQLDAKSLNKRTFEQSDLRQWQ